MRIISGRAGGRRLRTAHTGGTRPATDLVREAVFSSLGGRVKDADVADLYAGSGSFGLEALSRGACSAVFVENGRAAGAALRHNLDAVDLGGEIVNGTVESYLERTDRRFHLVFMDPPWRLETGALETQMRALAPLLAEMAEVVVSRRHTDRIPEPPEIWRVAAKKRYGDTRILRYQKMKT